MKIQGLEILEEEKTEKLKNRFLKFVKVNEETGCWEWCGFKDKDNYGRFRYNTKLNMQAHRFSYAFFVGQINDDLIIMHECDNTKCVCPDHLKIGTHADNSIDMCTKERQHHRIQVGSKNNKSKLIEENVVIIKKMLKRGFSQKNIASMFEVSQPTISNIKAKRFWKHV